MKSFLSKINFQNIYRHFFYAFLFFLPLQGRKVFETQYTFYTGNFTEYTTFFVYITDILLILALVFFVFSTPKEKWLKKWSTFHKKYSRIINLLALYILWIIIITLINQSYLEVKVYNILKTLELAFFVLFSLNFFSKHKNSITGLYVIIFSAFFQSIIGIYQFLSQKSFFNLEILQKISGETILSNNSLGVAKIEFMGEKIVRSYGTFPHPNLLGGFLTFTIFITLFLYLRHNKYILSSNICKYFKINNTNSQVKINSIFWFLLFFSQITALLFSFSRSAWIALFISSISTVSLYIIFVSRETKLASLRGAIATWQSRRSPRLLYSLAMTSCCSLFLNKKVSRETILNLEFIKKYKELFISIILAILIIITNFSLFQARIWENTDNSKNVQILNHCTFSDRNFYNNVSRETIYNEPLTGFGPGTFIFQINKYTQTPLEYWQYQPAHNIFLLVASETGLIGLIITLFILTETIKICFSQIVSRETINDQTLLNILILSVFIGILFIGLFDHYLITIQQGRLLFCLTISILILNNVSRETN